MKRYCLFREKHILLLKNLSTLKERPESFQGKVFERLFELAEVKQLTKKDMEKYRKSILEYSDVRSAVSCAREEGVEKGIEKGVGIGINKVIQKCLQRNMPIEEIVFLTGYTKEQIISCKSKN